jgi:glutamate-1-semialdehyde 2,1-aminomutase
MRDYLQEYTERTPTSQKLYEQAKQYMPGGVSHSYRYFPPYPLFINRVEGSRIWDVDGNEYIDLWMGHGALILGHRPDIVNQALQEVVNAGTHWGILHEPQVELARLVCEMVPCAEKMRFCVSGTEATMYAVRLARGFTGRRIILKMDAGWHGGNTDLAVAIKAPFDQPESAGLPPEMLQFTHTVPFNDVEATLAAMHACRDDLAGVILEPVMGAGGMIPAEPAFLKALREETARLGAMLIFDEVITGFRLAPGGAQEYFGVVPDLVTLGKITGGGSNIGVIAGRSDVMAMTDPTIQRKKGEGVLTGGGTFSATPMSMIPGLTVLRHLRNHASEVYPYINTLGDRLRRGMEEAFERGGLLGKTVGTGSLVGAYLPLDPSVTVRTPAEMYNRTDLKRLETEFRIRMLNHGLYASHGGGTLSTAHTEADIQGILGAVEDVAREMR